VAGRLNGPRRGSHSVGIRGGCSISREGRFVPVHGGVVISRLGGIIASVVWDGILVFKVSRPSLRAASWTTVGIVRHHGVNNEAVVRITSWTVWFAVSVSESAAWDGAAGRGFGLGRDEWVRRAGD